jgi:uncharacterized protein
MASMSQITIPVFVKHLNALAGCLKKAQALCTEKKYDESALMSYRLYPDMFAFVRQVQQATEHARNCTGALAGVEAPKYEMNEKSLADLIGRIEKSVAWLNSVKPDQLDGTEGKSVTVKAGDRELTFTGLDLVLKRSMPNFYFHCTTAYDILRHNGVDLGKRDFMGS